MTLVSLQENFSHETKEKIQAGVIRLNEILPLKARQKNLSSELAQLHRDILTAYIEMGRSLNRSEISQHVTDVDIAVKILQENDLVVFDEKGEPIGAYPFTMETREHQVRVNGHTIYSMCALDALSISPMFNINLEILSQCRLSAEAIKIHQQGYSLLNEQELAEVYFAIDWNAASANTCCANSLCTEMIFLKGDELAGNWRLEAPEHRDIYTLAEAIHFGAGFFMPLMQK